MSDMPPSYCGVSSTGRISPRLVIHPVRAAHSYGLLFSILRSPKLMPSIDFTALRLTVSMAQVLDLLQFHPVSRSGDELRGPCPVHESSSPTSRSFSADLRKNAWRCFRCHAGGNQLDLWAQSQKLSLHAAALDLCERLAVPVPQLGRRNAIC